MEPAEAPQWLTWLQQTALAGALRDSSWLHPTAEILHILTFVFAVGSLLILDLRLVGLGRGIAFDQVAGALLPWAIGAFCLTIPTGILLLLPEAPTIAPNPAFLIKMAMMVLAGINASLFHLGPWRRRESWLTGLPPLAARVSGVVSILLWVGVIASGRLIAYV
jgi:Family of unknown function (DUF6644)